LKKKNGFKAQAIVEFAIALPILLVLVIGIFEVARVIFIYSAVTNASRNASRYASAVGRLENGLTKYNYCQGIKDLATQSAYLVPLYNVEITYDDGLGNPLAYPKCNVWNVSQVDPNVKVSSGNRVTVKVTVKYTPMLKLVPITSRDIVASSSRTILGVVDLKE